MWDGFKQTISTIGEGGHQGTQALGSIYMGFLAGGGNLSPSLISSGNRFLATTYLRATGQLANFSEVTGFRLSLGLSKKFIYHNSIGAAENGRWFSPMLFSDRVGAYNGLALGYKGSRNMAQNVYTTRYFGLSVGGKAAPQGTTLGGGLQNYAVPKLGFKYDFKTYKLGW